MTRTRTIVLMAAFLFCLNARAYPCTTFTINDDGHVVYGRNMDWWVGSGLIVVNQRDIAKQALLVSLSGHEGSPAKWVSRYGSVTFNGLAKRNSATSLPSSVLWPLTPKGSLAKKKSNDLRAARTTKQQTLNLP